MATRDRGYLRSPAINGDDVIFVCEDDLWLTQASGGRAFRLTAGVAEAGTPRISPDGELVAFTGREEGPPDVYVMPFAGGSTRRLTYHGGRTAIIGFEPGTGAILYGTDADQPFRRERWLHRVSPDGGLPELLPLGPANWISYGPDGRSTLSRLAEEPARWKRYRGGWAGEIWVDPAGDGEYRRLLDFPSNLARPCWVGDRIYFISDHEGVGNVYSCTPAGSDLRRHTDHDDFYARELSTDGRRLVYQAGAALWLLDPEAAEPIPLDVRLGSSRTQRGRQYVSADRHLDTATIAPDGTEVAITARGKAYTLGNWAGAVRQHGAPDGVRYRLLTHIPGTQRLVAAASNDSDREVLVVLDGGSDAPAPRPLAHLDLGRLIELTAAPSGERVAVTNHRQEIYIVDLTGDEPRAIRVDASAWDRIADPAWSADGRWLAYTHYGTRLTSAIKVADAQTGETRPVTEPVLRDRRPAWDPAGRYLYFIGQRDFDPVYDEQQFDLGFPRGARPYAVTLRAGEPAPFVPTAEPLRDPEDEKHTPKKPPAVVEIDFDGIEHRAVAFPVVEGRYERVAGTHDKVMFTWYPITAAKGVAFPPDPALDRTLEAIDLRTLACEELATGLTDFTLTADGTALLLRVGSRLRVVRAGVPVEGDDEPGRKSGWIDLDRVKVSVRTDAEWQQMFREAWRLQREQFWVEDMSGVDWDGVYARYAPLVDLVGSRAEFSDLMWEMQGELGTSHAYESGGAYRPGPHYRQGFLGVDWSTNGHAHRIARVLRGDTWAANATSPLNRPGVNVREGDEVIAVGGTPVGGATTAGELLANLAEQEVQLTVRAPDGPTRTVTVRALADERAVRYRDWVETNRRAVHERTGGRVGYLHIPDMAADGYAEFHRAFLAENDYEGLIVDVRFNGGGHVSELLLGKLARNRLATIYTRWGGEHPYPNEAPRGPMVAIANEQAGSDGDIFSHGFKMLGLGPVIGKRTWGGVIGIYPRHPLADGTVTTQPEFSFGFNDIHWGLENHGTAPDIDVDITPQDYVKGADPQLDRAIAVVLDELGRTPAHVPNPADRPRLGRAPLPPRTPTG